MRTKSGDLICRPSLRCIYVPSDTQQIYQERNHRPSLPTLTRLFSRPLTARLEGYTCVIFCVARPVYFCALSGHRTNTRTLCLIIGQSWRRFICAPAHLIGSPNWRIRFARSYLAKLTASYRRREVKGQIPHSKKILIYYRYKTQPNPIQKNFCLFPHNTHYRLLSAKLETNTHCWTQFLPLLPSAACIHKRTNETAQWSVQFIAINLHIYRERSDVSLSLLSPRLGGSWQLPARQPLMLTANQAEAAGCLVLLWQRDNSELLLAWKRQYSEEKEETKKKAADSRE